jgi:hypothetical protein
MTNHGWLVGIFASMLAVSAVAAETQRQPAPPAGAVPTGDMSLGSVTISRAVTADGKPLPRGTYQVRLTSQTPSPAPGASPDRERWVEFLQGGQVKGRELATIVPASELKDLMPGPESRRVANNSSRVELLKGASFLRIWINRDGVNYLIHLPTGAATS